MKKGRIIIIAGLLVIFTLLILVNYNRSTSTPPLAKDPLKSAAVIEETYENGESMWILFHSKTCGPCIEMHRIFDQLQPEYEGKVRFISIDVDDSNNTEAVKAWGIRYIPATFILDSKGNISYEYVGIIPVDSLKNELNKVVQ
ncbi:MAG: thioredoxin family protein [Syntrophomonadaceae bacterium]